MVDKVTASAADADKADAAADNAGKTLPNAAVMTNTNSSLAPGGVVAASSDPELTVNPWGFGDEGGIPKAQANEFLSFALYQFISTYNRNDLAPLVTAFKASKAAAAAPKPDATAKA